MNLAEPRQAHGCTSGPSSSRQRRHLVSAACASQASTEAISVENSQTTTVVRSVKQIVIQRDN
eukprot:scaffold24508_cov66-Phaeocystis_antarctica.AAC.7